MCKECILSTTINMIELFLAIKRLLFFKETVISIKVFILEVTIIVDLCVQGICADSVAAGKVLEAYKLMLDFYGMKLDETCTGNCIIIIKLIILVALMKFEKICYTPIDIELAPCIVLICTG